MRTNKALLVGVLTLEGLLLNGISLDNILLVLLLASSLLDYGLLGVLPDDVPHDNNVLLVIPPNSLAFDNFLLGVLDVIPCGTVLLVLFLLGLLLDGVLLTGRALFAGVF